MGLVQGGLEVPYILLSTRYEKLLNKLYVEPKNKEIIGTFFSVVNEEGKQAEAKLWKQKK